MSQDADPAGRPAGRSRRSFLKGSLVTAAGTASFAALPGGMAGALAGPSPARTGGSAAIAARPDAGRTAAHAAAGRPAPLPPVLRSRQELAARGLHYPAPAVAATALPITQGGTTYEMAQEVRWLDAQHFAVGRWDGSLSVFEFSTAAYVGPLIHAAVNDPALAGVQMVTRLPGHALVSSNDDRSMVLWLSPSGSWFDLEQVAVVGYDPALGVATGGTWVGAGHTLAVGHGTGFLSLWRYASRTRRLTFVRSVDLRNPAPVNPWGLHDLHDVVVVADDGERGVVATGSEDGYVCLVEVPSGTVLSQTVFNPAAQRGINSVAVRGDALLVSNCSVGPDDRNLWYFGIDRTTWQISLRDSANLIIDGDRPQAFNFDTAWGHYSGGRCWFASTEEGALWMGTADAGLHLLGYQEVTSPLGSALAYHADPGRLAMVAYDLYQFVTEA